MANRTVKEATTVHGTNPQYLVEKIVRSRIYESRYWKEDCFALSAQLVVDKGIDLRFIGGIYGGNVKPSPFLCLILKMLQIQPDKDIIIEFLRQEEFKYVRALGAYYLRLTGGSLEIWKYLEPLYNDYRKVRKIDRMGQFSIIHMDEFVDMLLRDERVFDVILPRIQKRVTHEEANELEPRVSALEEDLEEGEDSDDEKQVEVDKGRRREERMPANERLDVRERDSGRGRDRDWERDRERHRDSDRKDRRPSPPSKRRRSRSPPSGHRRRSRSREMQKRRDRSRSTERRRRKSRSPRREKQEKGNFSKKEKKSKEGSESKGKDEKDENAEANALRAKLGLKPLRK